MNLILSVTIFISLTIITCAQNNRYDRFSGREIQHDNFGSANLRNCTIQVNRCEASAGSRVDGTCNNFRHPSRGSARGPYLRLLSPDYADDNQDLRRNWNGRELPSARRVRTAIQMDGRVVDRHGLNTAVFHFLQFIHFDVSLLMGPWDYLRSRTYCCQPEGREDPRCRPVTVPSDDPYLGVTSIRCLNFSRAETFQNDGCLEGTTSPEQINFQTPVLDLSTVYGVDENRLNAVRMYRDGLLNLERRGSRLVPQANLDTGVTNPANRVCLQNMSNETRCYVFGFPEPGNINLRTTSFVMFFMKEHNRLATELHRINPCWRDDRLFNVARQINIATAANIFMYELMPILLGYQNMLRDGLISERVQHITEYDDDIVPLVYAEFEIALRYYHTTQEGRIRMYDERYQYDGDLLASRTTLRQNILEMGNNFERINRGTFYQPSALADDVQDPEISERYYGTLQRASDVLTLDIQRGRDLGVRGYNDYRQICGLRPAQRFEDFADVIDRDKIEVLRSIYEVVDDVDLLAGIMSENFVPGALAGPTLLCIVSRQLHLLKFADRFWFERGNQFHSLTLPQLREIRNTNMARFACDNADGVDVVQPRAFRVVGPHNQHVSCNHIPRLDITAWRDDSCRSDMRTHHNQDRPHGPEYSQMFTNNMLRQRH